MASPISVSDYDFLEPSRDKEPLPGEEDYYDDPEQKSRAIKDKSKLWVEPPNWYKSLILIEVKTRDNLRDGCLACSDTWACTHINALLNMIILSLLCSWKKQ